jgi:thiamine-phosphate pyrophosphorylase
MLRHQSRSALSGPIHPAWPRIWLFTDKRNDEILERVIARLPRGSGIVFRHYHLPEALRRTRFETVKKLARRRGHIVMLAGSPELADSWQAAGMHGRGGRRSEFRNMPISAPVHNAREIHQANRRGADIFFLSPIFATRSHPGQRPLNPVQTRRLAALCNGAVIFLGGMNRQRYRLRKSQLTHGWAAIDAFG